ncbi:hypothetical protein BP5796_07154 [Coleophoma crateriformis]|uniref:Rhodopsin domain-containing protein n=1 Tax=Coleophoma crateriformis TaxID=565419 RepID=A0A3D8RI37_9HELO|nr:hypothetical protein BP5796_07154 [Coleophoma crateriformis]
MTTNTTGMDPALAAYLAAAMQIAATQDLSQDQRTNTRNLSIVFLVMAVFFVGFRFAARFKQRAKIMMDDWLMVLSLLLLAGNLACVLVMISYGLGLHSGALSLTDAEMLGKILLVNEPLYVTNINVIKLSLLLLYYRIFPLRSVKLGCYVLGAISIAWNVTLLGVSEGQCNPRAKAWAPWLPGTCINLKATFLAISIPSILTDLAILALPLPHVWRLQTNLTQRVMLMVIFLLGSFVVFTSIYRFTVYLSYDPNDLPYTLALGCAWNIVELSSGIISACLPTLGPLVRIVFTKLGGSSAASKRYAGNSKSNPGNATPKSGLVKVGGGESQSRSKSSDWNKLEDESKYGYNGEDFGSDKSLRLDSSVPRITVMVTGEGGSSSSRSSGGDIPLREIHQKTEVEWSESRKATGGTEMV